jgi:hypothetical protein
VLLRHRRTTTEVLFSVSQRTSPTPPLFVVVSSSSPTSHHAGTIPEPPRPSCRLPSTEHHSAPVSSTPSCRYSHPPWSGLRDLVRHSCGTVVNLEVNTSSSSSPYSAGGGRATSASLHQHALRSSQGQPGGLWATASQAVAPVFARSSRPTSP